MSITADTDLLVRLLTEDDVRQTRLARDELVQADLVAITLPALCELVWVLGDAYGVKNSEIASAIRRLIEVENVAVDLLAVEAGLAVMDEGGDFADGVIAHQGAWLGGAEFVSFDRKAVKLMTAQGRSARLLK